MTNFLPYRYPPKGSATIGALSREDILQVVADAIHGLSAKLDLFYGRSSLGAGLADSPEYRAKMNQMAEDSDIYAQLLMVRDYAVDGIFPEFLFNFGEVIYDVMAFTYAQLRPFNYMDEFYGVPTSGNIEILKPLLIKFFARWKLDVPHELEFKYDFVMMFAEQMDLDESRLSLTELALLANMTERSVRNATQRDVPPSRRLRTKKERYFVYVDREEAIRWLSGRRGFIKSTLPDGFPTSVFRPVTEKLGISIDSLTQQHDLG
ncbi:hypothetical protein CEW83_14165 [Parazoarcus communis]|uniref:Uncharacterized protein n=1 Tax=Parazoarcus communis TaxID=41977 RepID=A0A2U8GRY1_9RHOO|nr:hypothetical protein [Parazoarcus communis]AWI76218.1 hypothetical protein CEW83_14165 [Parazoarcus communis]